MSTPSFPLLPTTTHKKAERKKATHNDENGMKAWRFFFFIFVLLSSFPSLCLIRVILFSFFHAHIIISWWTIFLCVPLFRCNIAISVPHTFQQFILDNIQSNEDKNNWYFFSIEFASEIFGFSLLFLCFLLLCRWYLSIVVYDVPRVFCFSMSMYCC